MEQFILAKGERDVGRVQRFVAALSTARAWKITIVEHRKERSDPQNNALWGVAYKKLAAFTGEEPSELHDIFMRRYFGEVEYEVLGEIRTRPYRTTTTDENGNRDVMPVDKFTELYRFIQKTAAEYGCDIPDPDPLWFLNEEKAA